MVSIRIEYDKYNRTFKLRDREFGSILEDGTVYELVLPIRTAGLDEEDVFPSIVSAVAPA